MYLKNIGILRKGRINTFLLFTKKNFINEKKGFTVGGKKPICNDLIKNNNCDEDFNKAWKYIIRNNYINKIVNIFKKKNDYVKGNDCYFILGGEGVGKKFFLEKAKERFLNETIENSSKKKYIFFEYDFKITEGESFQIKLYKFDVFLRSHLLKVIDSNLKNGKIKLKDLFDYAKNQNKNFFIDLQNFFNYILNNDMYFDFIGDKEKLEIKKCLNKLEKNEFGFDHWNYFVKTLLQKLNVKCFCNHYNEMSAGFYFLRMIAEYKEQVEYYEKSQKILVNYSNGLYIYTYFLFILQFLETQFSYQFYFIFYNFHLALLCMQPERSFFFFQKMINENIKNYHIPVIIHSLKNIEMMKFIFVYNNIIVGNYIKEMNKRQNITNDNYGDKDDYTLSSEFDNERQEKENQYQNKNEYNRKYNGNKKWNELENYELLKNNLIEINDFSFDMIKCIFIPQFTTNEKIVKYIYNTVGGNIHLIKIICKGLYEMNKENSDSKILKDLEKEKKEMVTYDIDEEGIDKSRSVEEIVQLRKYEKEKLFLKNMTEQILCQFILNFEQKIITFFSLPDIEKMKQGDFDANKKPLNYIQFYYTVFEVIRYFLKKDKVFCKNIINLNNPILLGLIDVNIIQYNYEFKCLELTNRFYEILLKNYISFKYKQFPLKLRAQYNIHHVLNYKIISHEYKLLETQ